MYLTILPRRLKLEQSFGVFHERHVDSGIEIALSVNIAATTKLRHDLLSCLLQIRDDVFEVGR